ncbi:MAG: dNTP triphosphohydrolase [Magnetococcales bacterium]|nr:dNTP triphosphohydrolase [Magnetococcales bacterium]
MEWEKLMATSRHGSPISGEWDLRHPVEVDLDRITFSASFRRLKDKTQVHALPDNDHVRNRLTHSIETASVGRSIGVVVGNALLKKNADLPFHPSHFGSIVQAACLAHDIGNPPFGHDGEVAIRSWFEKKRKQKWFKSLSEEEQSDFLHFEGNAQGFRILTNLEMGRRSGGLRLTHAVLGAFGKYPRTATVCHENPNNDAARKKNGLFISEISAMREVAEATGMMSSSLEDTPCWHRHPFAYLMEAADDICYGVVDIEDGFELGFLNFHDASTILADLADWKKEVRADTTLETIRFLRAMAIGKLIEGVSQTFVDHEQEMLEGRFPGTLINASPLAAELKAAKNKARDAIYKADAVVMKMVVGHRMIHALMDIFHPVVMKLHDVQWRAEEISAHEGYLALLFGKEELAVMKKNPSTTPGDAIRFLTDFISGMTDGYTKRLFQKLHLGQS